MVPVLMTVIRAMPRPGRDRYIWVTVNVAEGIGHIQVGDDFVCTETGQVFRLASFLLVSYSNLPSVGALSLGFTAPGDNPDPPSEGSTLRRVGSATRDREPNGSSVREALTVFRSEAQRLADQCPNQFGTHSADWAETLTRENGALRMRWDSASEMLVIELSHGPTAGAAVGWLELYRASMRDGTLSSDSPDVTLESAIDYGLELMGSTLVRDQNR